MGRPHLCRPGPLDAGDLPHQSRLAYHPSMTGTVASADKVTAPPARRDPFAVVVSAVAVGLGLLAFVADLVEGVGGQVLVALTSSGFAWGLAAFLVGRWALGRWRAVIAGVVLLVAATLIYFLLVTLVSRRWSGGSMVDPDTGMMTSADAHGLRSIAITALLWLVGSVIAGPLLAMLGQTVRSAGPAWAALAAGVGCGLLSGEGWFSLWRTPLWRLDFSDPYTGEFAVGVATAEMVRIVLPLGALIWLAVVHRLGRAWPTLVAATANSAMAGTRIWAGIEHARYLI